MSELNISFLGSPLISRAQTGEITFPKRKALALFAYLAVKSDHPHSRESLMGLLWPELPTSAAQNNLRVTWSQVRKHLGEDQDGSDPYLVSTRLDLGFNPKSDHTLDVRLFLDLIAATRAHGHSNLIECSECAERLTQAIELARGKFLGDFSLGDCPAFDEWLSVQRERLHLQITTTLEELVDFHEHAGQTEDAEQYVKRLLEIDPLRERAHRQLMRLLADSGQRSAALEQYETCRRLLANELGVAPAPETILLAEQIRALAPTRKDKPRHNLPPAISRFIGREQEKARLQDLLTSDPHTLVTLAGPGGVGKTRLGLQVAHDLLDRFADGVWLVELAGVEDAEALPGAVAAVLNLVPDPRRSLTRTLGDYLRDKSMLLLLDNCEHLLEPCAQLVKALRSSAPGLTVFSTSRIPLHLDDEKVIRLQPLPSPDLEEVETLTAIRVLEYDSIQLFASRAMQALLSFSITDSNALPVAQICHHLDGIPLAIELAAARTSSMPVEAIAKRLDQRFRWLNAHTQGNLPRQKTLYNLIDWSYELLNDQERALFCRLSVFAGGWTLEMAEAVCEDVDLCAELLGQLVDGSLVTFGYDPEKKRYRMHETIRQFAAAKLTEMGDDAKRTVLEKHHIYFTNLLASQKAELQGTNPSDAINLIRTDLENIRHAWQWGVSNGQLASIREGVKGLSDFYAMTGLSAEGEGVLALALSATDGDSNLEPAELLQLQVELLTEQAVMLTQQAKLDNALEKAEQALLLAMKLEDDPFHLGLAHLTVGRVHARNSEYLKSRDYLEKGLVEARQADIPAFEGEILRDLAAVLLDMDERELGVVYLQQSLAIMRKLGNQFTGAIHRPYAGC